MPFANLVKSEKLNKAIEIISQFTEKPITEFCLYKYYDELLRNHYVKKITPEMIAERYMVRNGYKIVKEEGK